MYIGQIEKDPYISQHLDSFQKQRLSSDIFSVADKVLAVNFCKSNLKSKGILNNERSKLLKLCSQMTKTAYDHQMPEKKVRFSDNVQVFQEMDSNIYFCKPSNISLKGD